MEPEKGTWDSVLLENLTEDCFINNIHQRYKQDHIHTYIGTSVVAVNPYRHISENSLDIIRIYGSKGLFQLPPHIYGLANLAYQSLKDQNEDQCVVLSGEGGSGKTESFKMIVNFLTRIQEDTKANLKKTISTNTDSYIKHRRASSSCSANFSSSKVESAASISRQKSPSPGAFSKCESLTLVPMRAESSERNTKNITREKMVDFDFSHHKSSEYISESDIPALPCHYTGKKLEKFFLKNPCLPLRSGNTKSSLYLSTFGINGCSLCGHSRCNRVQSKKQEDNSSLKLQSQRGSCSNLYRQQSAESQADSFSCTTSNRRISLYDAHKLCQTLNIKSSSRSKHKTQTQRFRECVTCADVFLEAMGNAATLQNNNSSRYGKLFDIEIDFKGDPIGVHITHYMLEKIRVTDINNGERNFHIFYQLLLGAEMQLLKKLKLQRNVEKYELLKNTSAFEEDRTNFHYTKKSLDVLGICGEDVDAIFCVIASVLKLGNLIFVPVTNIDGTEGCQVSNIYEMQETAHLLRIDDQSLLDCLTRGSGCNSGIEDIGFEMDARNATSLRSTLCRTLYSRLFTLLVNKINDSLKSTKREKNLALLDFFGFEVLGRNSFEQFAINYSSEKIHQYFVCNALKLKQDLYLREGLEWTRIDFFDNESICELIDKPNYGILSIINEKHLNTDEALLVRMQQCCAGHPNFMTCGPNLMSFKIRHFANVVNYNINFFLQKNSDMLPKYTSATLYQSKLPLVRDLFPEGNPKRHANKKPTTLSCNMRTQMQTLLSIVKNRRSHYVFCIKPNDRKQPQLFDLALVQHQVRYMNLMPLVNLCRMGHCFHLSHAKFFSRYKSLNSITWPHYHSGSTIEGIALIIRNVPLPSAEFTIGIKNIFIRSPRAVYELEEFRKARLNDLAILLQKTFRMYALRKRFLIMRESQIVIASAWRTWRAQEEYRTIKYKKQVKWASYVICRCYRNWKIRQYLLTLPLCLPSNTLSPLSTEWPVAPRFLTETSELLRGIYYRWKCCLYRNSFDQTSRNRMREKVTASIIFKDRKASYFRSVGHPFIGDYVRLRHHQQWKKVCTETNDQYVVFADIINKITRSSGKFVPILLVLSTSSLLLLDQRTLQIKYRIPASEIYRISLSPFLDDIAIFHVKAKSVNVLNLMILSGTCHSLLSLLSYSSLGIVQSDFARKKGDFIFQTGHVIEIVTKMFLVIQNATGKPPEVHINTEFEANFGQQTVTFSFKYGGMSEASHGQPKVLRKANRMEVIV